MSQQEATHHPLPGKQQGEGQITRYAWLSLLRAYGVVLVLLFHFFPWLMPGGFIGVDVFFVFSGYLITSLLIKEFRKQGKVSLIAFYKRRFRRLFPALFAMLVVTLALSLTIPADFRADIARQAAATLSWTTNFYEIAGGQSYADALLPHLFVHTWTLSIEMQYYLVWGLLLTILLPLFISTASDGRRSIARSRKVVALLAGALVLVSYIVMQVMLIGASDPSAAYYSTFSHAYPILIGSALGALAGFGRSSLVRMFERLDHRLGIAITVASLLVITALALFLPFENRLVYSVGLLLTSLLVGLIIVVGRGAQKTLHQLPEPKILVYLADRSYSIYLFHWPAMIIVLEWARALFGTVQVGLNPLYILTAVVGLALTFVASHLSYKFIEQPFASSAKKRKAQPVDDSRSITNPLPVVAKRERATARTDSFRATDASRGQNSRAAQTGSFSTTGAMRKQEAVAAQTGSFRTAQALSTHENSAAQTGSFRAANKEALQDERAHDSHEDAQAQEDAPETLTSFRVQKRRIAIVVAVAVLLLGTSGVALAFAPNKTTIESDYQVGLLELDRHQLENSHEALVHTGLGGSMNGEPGPIVKPGTITVIGDSVTIYPAEQITELTGAHVDAEVSRAMVNGIRILDEYQANRLLGETVVIALATNAHADSFESAVAICDKLAPGHRLIFVTGYGDESMDELASNLRSLPETYPFVTIADWNEAVADHDDLLAADGYHLAGKEAIDLYVDVVVEAIEEAKDKPTS